MSKDKIPTAKSFWLKEVHGGVVSQEEIIKAMIEFTKLHVKAALEATAEYMEFNEKEEYLKQEMLNSYPDENIQ